MPSLRSPRRGTVGHARRGRQVGDTTRFFVAAQAWPRPVRAASLRRRVGAGLRQVRRCAARRGQVLGSSLVAARSGRTVTPPVARDERTPTAPTVGLVVIGNEVLSAKVRDENGPLLLDRLARGGARVVEVAMVRDDPDRIAAVVREFAARFDHVITTGGVGPTHDDCTWIAIGRALQRPLALHAGMLERMEARNGGPLTPEQQRLAVLPEGTELVGDAHRWPLLKVANVWVLPGVPSMVAHRADKLAALLGGPRPWLCTVFFGADEWVSVPAIDSVVAAFDDVEVGSYPVFHDADHRLRVTFEGGERERVEAAATWLSDQLGTVVRIAWSGGTLPELAEPVRGAGAATWQP
ncbi:MAG: competence/damage-inducible protein A [Myxococcales bacterium]|nr:competence/damage-inducible protein A [Myxococcales bacterium]